ncbi:MAG: hypothetical protein MZV64_62445 [Ignavibacteriales bacterium]|nr:hypothetical protein [Ignavibacteriales bacterium]
MIKHEADNCFAIFPDPLAAVNAALAMQHSFEASNLMTSDDLDIYISCGSRLREDPGHPGRGLFSATR